MSGDVFWGEAWDTGPLIEMDWTADTQRVGLGLDAGVRKIGLHATCQEKISYLLLIGGLTTSLGSRRGIRSLK